MCFTDHSGRFSEGATEVCPREECKKNWLDLLSACLLIQLPIHRKTMAPSFLSNGTLFSFNLRRRCAAMGWIQRGRDHPAANLGLISGMYLDDKTVIVLLRKHCIHVYVQSAFVIGGGDHAHDYKACFNLYADYLG